MTARHGHATRLATGGRTKRSSRDASGDRVCRTTGLDRVGLGHNTSHDGSTRTRREGHSVAEGQAAGRAQRGTVLAVRGQAGHGKHHTCSTPVREREQRSTAVITSQGTARHREQEKTAVKTREIHLTSPKIQIPTHPCHTLFPGSPSPTQSSSLPRKWKATLHFLPLAPSAVLLTC